MSSFNCTFVRFTESRKTAIVMARAPFAVNAEPVYLNAEDVKAVLNNDNPSKGDTFKTPANLQIIDFMVYDEEEDRQVVATTKDGVVLKTLAPA